MISGQTDVHVKSIALIDSFNVICLYCIIFWTKYFNYFKDAVRNSWRSSG